MLASPSGDGSAPGNVVVAWSPPTPQAP